MNSPQSLFIAVNLIGFGAFKFAGCKPGHQQSSAAKCTRLLNAL